MVGLADPSLSLKYLTLSLVLQLNNLVPYIKQSLWQRSGAVLNTGASQQDGSGSEPADQLGLLVWSVHVLLRPCGFPPTTPKTCRLGQLATLICPYVIDVCVCLCSSWDRLT